MPEYKNTAGKKKPQKQNKVFNTLRLGIFWAIVLLLGYGLFTSLTGEGLSKAEEKTITEILSYAKEGRIEKIEVTGNELKVTAKDNSDLPKNMISRKDGSGTLQEQGFEEVINEGKVSVEIKDNADMVIGSRFVKKIDTFQSTRARRAGIKIISFFIKKATGKKIYDTTSGFRAVNKEIIKDFSISYPLEYPEPLTTAEILKKKYRVKEIPVEMKERTGGVSSIRSWKNAYYMINVTLSLIIIGIRRYKRCN